MSHYVLLSISGATSEPTAGDPLVGLHQCPHTVLDVVFIICDKKRSNSCASHLVCKALQQPTQKKQSDDLTLESIIRWLVSCLMERRNCILGENTQSQQTMTSCQTVQTDDEAEFPLKVYDAPDHCCGRDGEDR